MGWCSILRSGSPTESSPPEFHLLQACVNQHADRRMEHHSTSCSLCCNNPVDFASSQRGKGQNLRRAIWRILGCFHAQILAITRSILPTVRMNLTGSMASCQIHAGESNSTDHTVPAPNRLTPIGSFFSHNRGKGRSILWVLLWIWEKALSAQDYHDNGYLSHMRRAQ